jgi:L-cysteine/cystine lyase
MTDRFTSAEFEQYLQQFQYGEAKFYFNYGGQGPMHRQTIAAILTAHEEIQAEGPFSGAVNDWINREEKLLREAIAQELGTTAGAIALTEDVTVGCNIALWGMEWQQGDRLLMTDCEHPGVIATVQELQRRFGIEVDICPMMATLNQGDPVALLASALQPRTRLVVLSHILWNTGQVLPMAEIVQACRAHSTQNSSQSPVRVLVDAAQSVGVLPLNLTELGVDFYAMTGHKWLCGPAGLGALYVRPEIQAELHPTFIGWRGVKRDRQGQPIGWLPDGRRYEIATSDLTLLPSLRAAIAQHHAWGTAEQRYQRIRELSRALWQQLNQIPQLTCLHTAPPEAGLVSFQIAGKGGSDRHSALVNYLEQQRIYLRLIPDPNCVRACVHYLTKAGDIAHLINQIDQFDWKN